MKDEPTPCDPKRVSLFFDQELPPEEHDRVSRHLNNCPVCQKELQDMQAVSKMFRAEMEADVFQAGLYNLERSVMDQIKRKKTPWWERLANTFISFKFLVPAAAAVAMLVISVSVSRYSAIEAGPSAIVDSFTGETSSVMIMETPDSQHTIIWFNEE